jgi:hypothetical protein
VQDEGEAPAVKVSSSQGVQTGSGNTQVNNFQSSNLPCSLQDFLQILNAKPSPAQRYEYYKRPEYKEYRQYALLTLPQDKAAEITQRLSRLAVKNSGPPLFSFLWGPHAPPSF